MKSLKHKLQLAFQLSASDWLHLIEAWISLLVYWLALRWSSFDSLSAPQFLIPSKKTAVPAELSFMQRLYQLVGWASHLHIFPMSCVEKSLALQWMLRRRGINAHVEIGAHKVSDGISAHAWVKVAGQIVGESEDIIANFKVLRSNSSPISKIS